MAEHGDTTPSRVRATPPYSPEISDAVVEAAARELLLAIDLMADLDLLANGDRHALCRCARAAISAAILADRESSRAEVERLKAELSQLKSDFEEAQQSESELEQACSDLDLQIEELTQERDAALSAASAAEEVLAKTIASIPVAMTAAVAEAVEVMRPFARIGKCLGPLPKGVIYDELIYSTVTEVRISGNHCRAASAFVEKHSPAICSYGDAK